jgi:hypothetical protein
MFRQRLTRKEHSEYLDSSELTGSASGKKVGGAYIKEAINVLILQEDTYERHQHSSAMISTQLI